MSIVNDFLLSMEDYYREFDSNAFVQNSKGALSGKFDAFDGSMDASIYIKSLNNAINELEDLWIDNRALKDFMGIIQSSPRFDSLGDVPSMMDTNIRINTDYLKDYSQNITINMNNLFNMIMKPDPVNPSYISSAVGKLNNETLVNAAKKNIVKSNDNIADLGPKNCMMPAGGPTISCNKDFVSQQVIPFANNFNTLKDATLKEANAVKGIIVDTVNEANVRNRASGNFSNSNPEYTKDINRALYQGQRGLMEVVSFTTYAVLRKIHAIEANARTCNLVLEKLNSISGPTKSLVTEGVLTDSIATDNIGEMADNLLQRNPVAYIDIANRVYDFHKGVIANITPPASEEGDVIIDSLVDGFEYNKEPYNTVLEITTVLGASFDTLNASLEDTLLIFDEVMDKAGLVGDINQRYQGKVSQISDTSRYDSTATDDGVITASMDDYKVILHEIKDYPDNMTTISNALSDLNEKVKLFEERLSTNVNGEFKNAALINELKVFMNEFRDQYKNLVNNIAGQFMLRLKKLSLGAERISVSIEEHRDEPFEVEEFVSTDTDFEMEVDRILYEYQRGITDIIMETMMEDFQIKMTEKTRHLRLVTEAQATAGPAQNTGSNTANNNNKAAGTNNAGAAQKASDAMNNVQGKLANLQNKIEELFDKLIQSYQSKMQLEKIKTFVNEHEAALLGADFSNQPISILPYEGMPFENITSEIDTVKNTCSGIKPGDVSTLNKPNLIFDRLFQQFNITMKPDSDLASCGTQAGSALRNRYKTGKSRLQVKNYPNSTQLVQTMVEFLKMYADNGQNDMINKINGLRDEVKNMSSNFGTNPTVESVDSVVYNHLKEFLEADGDAATKVGNEPNADAGNAETKPEVGQPTGGDTKADTSVSFSTYDLMNTIQTATRVYTGAVFNAVRDRVKDYLLVLGKLTKDTTAGMTNAGTEEGNEGNEEQQPAQEGQQ